MMLTFIGILVSIGLLLAIQGQAASLGQSPDGLYEINASNQLLFFSMSDAGALHRTDAVTLRGPPSAFTATPHDLYVSTCTANCQSKTPSFAIAVYHIGSTGVSRLKGQYPVNSHFVMDVWASPDAKMLYAVATDAQSGIVQAWEYKIEPNGLLIPLQPATQSVSRIGFGVLSTGDQGHYLYVANPLSGRINQFSRESDGTLKPLPTPWVRSGFGNFFMSIPESTKLLFQVNGASSQLFQYTIGDDGELGQPQAAIKPPESSGRLAFDPQEKFLYVLHGGSAPGIAVYALQPQGHLTVVSDVAAGQKPMSLAFSPDGRMLYVTDAPEKQEGQIEIFKRLSNGSLEAAGTVDGGPQPYEMALPSRR